MEWFNYLLKFYMQSPDWLKVIIFAGLIALTLLFFALWLSSSIGCRSAKKERGELKNRLQDKAKLLAEYQTDKEKLGQEKEDLVSKSKQLEDVLAISKANETDSRQREEQLQSKFKRNEKDLEILKKTIKSLLSEQGQYWYSPIKNNPATFRKREFNDAVIFSLINFKGGVGKTFISLFLALTMMKAGKKVLLIDLDYQGSLTELIVHQDILESEVFDKKNAEGRTIPGKTIQQIFLSTQDNLIKSITMPLSDHLDFIPAWDSLQNFENTAMIRWLVDYFKPKSTEPDVRMRLRTLLHETSVRAQYDFIILDCPPRLTTTSANALCAADYVLIPVIPDLLGSSVTDRLASSLRQFKFVPGLLSPEFKILGLVPNRVRLASTGKPQNNDAEQLRLLKKNIEGKWGDPLELLETNYIPIANAPCMGHLSNLTQNLSVCTQLEPYFNRLLTAIEDKIKL